MDQQPNRAYFVNKRPSKWHLSFPPIPMQPVLDEPDLHNNSDLSSVDTTAWEVKRDMTVLGNIYQNVNASTSAPTTPTAPLSRIISTFQIVDSPTPHFTGREDYLEKIHNRLKLCNARVKYADRIVLLHGLGGIGKSELARMYAEQYIDDPIIQNVCWIDAEHSNSLKTSFQLLALRLKLSTKDLDLDQIVKSIYQHFSDHVGTGLFIFDNAHNSLIKGKEFNIHKFLPSQYLKRRPLVLITARNKDWRSIMQENTIEVNQLEEHESIEFLTKRFQLTRSQKKDENELRAIQNLARSLQGYPLGLTLATSNIHNTGWSAFRKEIDNYITRMEEPNGNWIYDPHDLESSNKYQLIMNNVWTMTLEKMASLGNDGETALKLLNIMAYLSTDNITMEIVRTIFRFMHKELAPINSFRLLEKYSMISLSLEKNWKGKKYHRIRMHRLVQRCTRERLDRSNDRSYLVGVCRYLSHTNYRQEKAELSQNRLSLHRYLQEQNWSEDSIQYSIIFAAQLIQTELNASWSILSDIQDFLQTRQISKTNFRLKNFVQLFHACLFYFCTRKHYSNETMFTLPGLSKYALEREFMALVKQYFQYLLGAEDNDEGIGRRGTFILDPEQRYSYQVCYYTLKYRFSKLQKPLQTEIGTLLISGSNSSIGARLETAQELYHILWKYYLCTKDIYSRVQCMKTVCKKHNEVYSSLKHSIAEHAQLYWEERNPFRYYFIMDKVMDHENTYSRRNKLFAELFVAKGGPLVLVQHLEFLSTLEKIHWNDEDLLDFIVTLAYDCKCAEALVRTNKFMEAFHNFTQRVFDINQANINKYRLCCLTTWFALFSRRETREIRDFRGYYWSIGAVNNEMNQFLQQLKTGSYNIWWSFISTEKRIEILESFLKTMKGSTVDQGQVAVHTAKVILQLLRDRTK